MKYLKSIFEHNKDYENNSAEAMKDVFESYIDWNMIQDVVDMASDYIDDNCILHILIDYYATKENFGSIINISSFEHDMNNRSNVYHNLNRRNQKHLNLIDGIYELEPIDKNKITYQIYLTQISKMSMDASRGEVTWDFPVLMQKYSIDLVERVLDAYPDMKSQIISFNR